MLATIQSENAVQKVFGPPGTGKTTYLLNVMEEALEQGTPSHSVGYFSFTRKAANEAKERAVAKFTHLHEDTDFPWFRTLHSLAYRCLGISSKDIMSVQHYKDFAKSAGLELAVEEGEEEYIVRTDHPVLNEINIARIRRQDLRTYYNNSALEIEWYHFEYVERCYRKYKETHGLLDFTDLLERLIDDPKRLPRLSVLIIDEAQDLSGLQWDLVQALIDRSQKTFVASDDDQALYKWAGADVERLLDLPGEVKVLDQSYRIPARVHMLANQVVSRIKSRQPKTWAPRDFEGQVLYYNDYADVDVSQGQWLILSATNYLLNGMYDWLKSQGLLFERNGQKSIPDTVLSAVLGWEALRKGKEVPFTVVRQIYKYLGSDYIARGHKTLPKADVEALYSIERLTKDHGLRTKDIWHQALTKIGEDKRDYIIALLRRHVGLRSEANIKLSTIHGAKGGEADNVLLLTDLSGRFAKEYDRNPDDIHRLLYVAITRTRKALHIVYPKNVRRGFML
jgi:DNA helicase-2/ATP-dependent DNA helicase PcrA